MFSIENNCFLLCHSQRHFRRELSRQESSRLIRRLFSVPPRLPGNIPPARMRLVSVIKSEYSVAGERNLIPEFSPRTFSPLLPPPSHPQVFRVLIGLNRNSDSLTKSFQLSYHKNKTHFSPFPNSQQPGKYSRSKCILENRNIFCTLGLYKQIKYVCVCREEKKYIKLMRTYNSLPNRQRINLHNYIAQLPPIAAKTQKLV